MVLFLYVNIIYVVLSFSGGDTMIKYKQFEKEAFYNTLNRNLEKKIITKDQYNAYMKQHDLSETKFTNNGVGFYFDYNDMNINEYSRIILSGHNYTSKSHPDIMVEIILFVINETISCMEGQGYGNYIDPIFFEDYIIL